MSTTPTELLKLHRPFLKYDSHETYFADSAESWTDNPGNRLLKKDGTELAVAGGTLSLDFIGKQYRDGRKAAPTDHISKRNKRYAEDARALHVDPRYANRVYGHVVGEGDDIWLQYWYWYFYNDYNLIGPFIRAGQHEGDWEMIQIHLVKGSPDHAVYAQHKIAEGRAWNQVDIIPGTERPIVYVARGSHAAYFEPGTQWTGHWFDHSDGKRRSPEQTLEVVDESLSVFDWVRWPGRWGDTKAGGSPLDSDSPTGPGMKKQWDDPLKLEGRARAAALEEAGPEGPPPIPPSPPRVTVEWHKDGIRVGYRVFAEQGPWPNGLVVTLNSPQEQEPPTTEQHRIDDRAGFLDLRTPVNPAFRYDLYVSAATPDELASESVRLDLPPRGS
jgi:hypothetical protein